MCAVVAEMCLEGLTCLDMAQEMLGMMSKTTHTCTKVRYREVGFHSYSDISSTNIPSSHVKSKKMKFLGIKDEDRKSAPCSKSPPSSRADTVP